MAESIKFKDSIHLEYNEIFIIWPDHRKPGHISIETIEGKIYYFKDDKFTEEICDKIDKICGRAKFKDWGVKIGHTEILFSEIVGFLDTNQETFIYLFNGKELRYKLRNSDELIRTLEKNVECKNITIDYENKMIHVRQTSKIFNCNRWKNVKINRKIPFSSINNVRKEVAEIYSYITTVNYQVIKIFGFTRDDEKRFAEIELGKFGDPYNETAEIIKKPKK